MEQNKETMKLQDVSYYCSCKTQLMMMMMMMIINFGLWGLLDSKTRFTWENKQYYYVASNFNLKL